MSQQHDDATRNGSRLPRPPGPKRCKLPTTGTGEGTRVSTTKEVPEAPHPVTGWLTPPDADGGIRIGPGGHATSRRQCDRDHHVIPRRSTPDADDDDTALTHHPLRPSSNAARPPQGRRKPYDNGGQRDDKDNSRLGVKQRGDNTAGPRTQRRDEHPGETRFLSFPLFLVPPFPLRLPMFGP
ncbi:hypothetical protein M413DRAFT_33062 [Hebeloma cylindrosporum]|uniref:Uncharacterized protein n=1 Tax=Hebeloma cylindrosporum TaxID=76867 RepID=A0A0C3BD44_HEBCY|nr:hypothetical protein M413DRAFT_33062 [Hebeloma cylindrosporum h7]